MGEYTLPLIIRLETLGFSLIECYNVIENTKTNLRSDRPFTANEKEILSYLNPLVSTP